MRWGSRFLKRLGSSSFQKNRSAKIVATEKEQKIRKIMTTHQSKTATNTPTNDLPRSVPIGIHRPRHPIIRILLSEGSSLSARQMITALGRCGYILDVCDPHPLCISRFSRFVRHYYRCPAIGTDPLGYLAFVLHHLTQEPYEVLLPVHEQAFLFSKVQDWLPSGVRTALAPFDAFLQVQGKVAFTRLMERHSLPIPPTLIVRSRAELEVMDRFPCYIKTDYGTASQGVWRVTNRVERDRIALALEQRGLLNGTREIAVQEEATGVLCQAQAVFARGHLLAMHCTKTRAASVGGGHRARTGVDHPQVREHLVTLGRTLEWHGPLTVEYLFDEVAGRPTYIEVNPRLGEPMNAVLSGVNLADLTVRVALGETEASDDSQCERPGLHSHSLLAIILGIANRGGSRRELLDTIVQNVRGRGLFAESKEELTPVCMDPPSLIPLGVAAGLLLLCPRLAYHIKTSAVSAYSLTATAVETIVAFDRE
jgi:predicted ATP-grasp superfamily ATP-dependent carboligase